MELNKYKKIVFWPANICSLIFLATYSVTNFHLKIAESNLEVFSAINLSIWIFFVVDYFVMLYLSKDRIGFLKSHLIHLLVVLIPFLRLIRLGMLVILIVNSLSNLKNRILVSIPVFTSVATLLFVVVGAASVYDAEYHASGSNIKSPEDAFWWAAVTIFTVGYGDKFPVTTEGRIYGVLLMACGIAIVGTVTASFAGWLISKISQVESENEKIISILEKLEKKI